MVKKLEQKLTKAETLVTRPPVVVLLGHVDHGKTSLLDAATGSKFTTDEFGEITQSIRAVEIKTKFGKITFIDTPGHSYFSNLRGNGVGFADIALLVVSAVEGVLEQTVESINLVKKAQIPAIAVISKIDLAQAHPLRVAKQLAENGIILEGEGGQTPLVEVSAVKKTGIDDLIETIGILASLENLKADLTALAQGVILESFLDKKAGVTSLGLTKNGVLKTGSFIKSNGIFGKVKAIFDQNRNLLHKALPSQPMRILGLSEIVQAGSEFVEVGNFAQMPKPPQVSFKKSSLFERELAKKQLGIILKADSVGSKDAVLANLPKEVTVVASGVGQVTSSDLEMAQATESKIFGFNVGSTPDGTKLLAKQKDLFFQSQLIYELIDEIKREAAKLRKAQEEVLGKAQILKSFNLNGLKVAGCKVLEGYLATGGEVKIVRGDKEIGRTKIVSMKQLAESVEKVTAGSECGVGFATYVDFQVGDVLKLVS